MRTEVQMARQAALMQRQAAVLRRKLQEADASRKRLVRFSFFCFGPLPCWRHRDTGPRLRVSLCTTYLICAAKLCVA